MTISGPVIEPAAPLPHRDTVSLHTRLRARVAAFGLTVLDLTVLGLAFAAILMLAGPASARVEMRDPGCGAASVTVMSEGSDRASASVRATDVAASVETAAGEFGLPRAAPDTVRLRWPDVVAFADVTDRAPAYIADGSPHRPPRAG